MKKTLFSLVFIILATLTVTGQNGRFNRLKVKTTPAAATTDEVIARKPNGLLVNTGIQVGSLGGSNNTASNGLNLNGTDFRLGGSLLENTLVDAGAFTLQIGRQDVGEFIFFSDGLEVTPTETWVRKSGSNGLRLTNTQSILEYFNREVRVGTNGVELDAGITNIGGSRVIDFTADQYRFRHNNGSPARYAIFDFQGSGLGVTDQVYLFPQSSGRLALESQIPSGNFLENIVEDLSPQLGADLDTQTFSFNRTVTGGAMSFNSITGFQFNVSQPTGFDSDFTITGEGVTNILFRANRLGEITAPSQTIAIIDAEVTGRALITKEYADANYAGGGASSGLESIDEGNGNGWRLIGRDANNYGDIGQNATDLSFSNSASTTKGATGQWSFVTGQNNTASGLWAFAGGVNSEADGAESLAFGADVTATSAGGVALGRLNTASAQYAFTGGFQNTSSGTASTTFGNQATASGEHSTAFGRSVFARSPGEVMVGYFGVDYTPSSNINWIATDRQFVVANGTTTTPRNAFTIYKNGAAVLTPVSKASITNAEAGMFIMDADEGNKLKFYDGTAWQEVSFVAD